MRQMDNQVDFWRGKLLTRRLARSSSMGVGTDHAAVGQMHVRTHSRRHDLQYTGRTVPDPGSGPALLTSPRWD
jgi:hypothetical protein